MHPGTHDMLLALDVEFRSNSSAEGVSRAVDRIERSIRDSVGTVGRIYIESRRGRGRRRRLATATPVDHTRKPDGCLVTATETIQANTTSALTQAVNRIDKGRCARKASMPSAT